ncbi:hypothetical protein [Arthrobacter sp. UYEF21]|uniref:hypothetical protein n=1 Tax=Arthrobacter sp. UYEF21 TaxID=1756364 RepID=UPI003396618F
MSLDRIPSGYFKTGAAGSSGAKSHAQVGASGRDLRGKLDPGQSATDHVDTAEAETCQSRAAV